MCLATSGPGGIHLLNGLYDAKLRPGALTQQEIELDKLYMDVAAYNVESVADLACRTALAYRGVAHITIATDLQDQETEPRSKGNVPAQTSDVSARGAGLPDERELRQAADVLNAGHKVAILAGQGTVRELV